MCCSAVLFRCGQGIRPADSADVPEPSIPYHIPNHIPNHIYYIISRPVPQNVLLMALTLVAFKLSITDMVPVRHPAAPPPGPRHAPAPRGGGEHNCCGPRSPLLSLHLASPFASRFSRCSSVNITCVSSFESSVP